MYARKPGARKSFWKSRIWPIVCSEGAVVGRQLPIHPPFLVPLTVQRDDSRPQLCWVRCVLQTLKAAWNTHDTQCTSEPAE
jgi:hypothetical protein